MIRLGIIFAVLVGLIVFTLYNLSPSVPIAFLGLKTVALPLAVWILVAIAAGFFTSLGIAGFLQLADYMTEKELLSRSRQSGGEKQPNSSPGYRNSNATTSRNADEEDDFEFDEDFEEDDDTADKNQPISDSPKYQDYAANRTAYDRPQEPKTQSQSGSVYSYSYREPKDSAVGKTEKIYDADYRVITPPSRKVDEEVKPVENDWERNNNKDDDDDWGFFDDDEFDDKKR